MSARMSLMIYVLTLAVAPNSVHAKSELVRRESSFLAKVDTNASKSDLRNAFGEVLGCGGSYDEEQWVGIEKKLLPIWNSLPKSNSGRIERRLLRYLANRYFMHAYAIMIRGFEPSRSMKLSLLGAADILSQQVPAYLEAALESQHVRQHGFDMHDAVQMVATLEKLISDSEVLLLERVYQQQRKPIGRALTLQGLEQVLRDYMMHLVSGDDEETIQVLLADKSKIQEFVPDWDKIAEYASGQIRALDFRRQRAPIASRDGGSDGLAQRYSFNDVREVVGSITRSFASFWDNVCVSMTDKLLAMDTHNTGRVPLSKFYSSGEWRFAESEEYLRQLGALDETSRWHGKEVIIPNYIHAASNCMITTQHYLLCCVDPCERIFGEIETEIGAPVALSGRILTLVGNMTTQTTLDHEDPPQLKGSLTQQLDQIASTHGGKVPLHGRLFAQWLHYVFPRECPFPHRSGTTSMVPPHEFGQFHVSEAERVKHSSNVSSVPVGLEKEEMQWMSQWSSEEELISDYDADLRAPWEVAWSTTASITLVIIASITGFFSFGQKSTDSNALLSMRGQAHFV